MGFNVTALPNYVEQNKGELVAKSVFGATTVDYMTVQTGLKGKTAINILDVDVTFQDGKECGFNPEGEDKLTQRYINPKHIKVDKEWCDKDLLGKYAQYEVITAASGKELPFEAEIMGQLTDGIVEGIEKMVWSSGAQSADEGAGLLDILSGETVPSVTKGSKSYMAALQEAYLALPTAVIGKSDLYGYLSPKAFEGLVFEMVNNNMYHYNPNDGDGVITMAGTNVKLVRCNGFDDASGVLGMFARKSNLFYGVDLASDSADIDVWYSKDNRTFRATAEFVVGVQIAFPNEVSLLKA